VHLADRVLEGKVDIAPPDQDPTVARKERQTRGWLDPLAFSPDGKWLAAMGRNALHIWKLDTGAHRVVELEAAIVDFGIAGETAIIATRDGLLHAIPLAAAAGPRVLSKQARVQRIAIGPNHEVATAGFDGKVQIWNVPTQTPKLAAHHHPDFDAVGFSSDGKLLLSGDEHGHAIFSPAPHFVEVQPNLHLHHPVLDITASPNASYLGITTSDGAYLVEAATRQVRSLRLGHAAGRIAFSPDGKRFVVIHAARFAHEWFDDIPHDEAGLRAWIKAATKIEQP
jgi:WD40 repeat protein